MLKSKELLPLTGYIHGGCSPIGMKKFFTRGLKVIREYTFHESSTRGSRPKFFEMIKFIEKQKEPVALI